MWINFDVKSNKNTQENSSIDPFPCIAANDSMYYAFLGSVNVSC